MRPKLRSRLSFANVTAMVALFVSLGGSVYAASKINGSKIKKESIAGNRLKPDGVTGQQIAEASLGKVPSAQSADSAQSAQTAQSADSAQTLAGTGPGGFVSSADVRRLRFDVTIPPAGTGPVSQTVLDLSPMTLTASCSRGPGGAFTLSVTSSAAGAGIDIGYALDGGDADTFGGLVGPSPVEIAAFVDDAPFHRAVGNIVYNDPQTTIAIPFAVYYSEDPSGTRCFFTGTATKAVG